MIEPRGQTPDQVVALAQASIQREWRLQNVSM